LRVRFGDKVRERNVDHDHERLTGTRFEHMPVRTFFLGEVWWVDRFALGDCRPHREGSSHRPALVTRRQEFPHEPVEMAPSVRRSLAGRGDLCFEAQQPPENLQEGVFLLLYRRPVGREWVGGPMGAIGGMDKQRLQQVLAASATT
jgi:hypothetical protein